MGSYLSIAAPPDESFVTLKSHKLYIVIPTAGNFVKLGYTGQSIGHLWKVYRRSYGQGMEIHRLYPCEQYKDDDPIHDVLQEKYGLKDGGRELYRKECLKDLVTYLDKRCGGKGVGPFRKGDLPRYRDNLPPLTPEEFLLVKTKKLSLHPPKKRSIPRK